MKTKVFYIIFAFMLQLFTLPIAAQVVSAQQESQDSLINVIAYFCKNDTLSYLYEDYEAKVENNDTIVDHYIKSEIQLVVVDSTSKGYVIEYTPIKTTIEAYKDTMMAHVVQTIMDTMGDVKYLLSTDEYGTLQHIENWAEVRDYMKKSIKLMSDSLYGNYPQLNEIIPRQRFEAKLSSYYVNEQAYYKQCEDLQLLFQLYGKSYRIGKTERDESSQNGFPQHLVLIASYGKTDEEDGFDDDYYIHCGTETIVPKEEVKDLVKGMMNMMVSDKHLDELNQGIDSTEYTEAKIFDAEEYNYFYNGWPCGMTHSKLTEIMGTEKHEIKSLIWTSRRWGVFGGESSIQTDGTM